MAKCSRKQRDRAVDLYIKYERCAADVIREFGYHNRGSLWMWHKDRLEEERTGVSRRGERYRRYSDERTETGRGGPLSRIQQTARPHDAASMREVVVDRRAFLRVRVAASPRGRVVPCCIPP